MPRHAPLPLPYRPRKVLVFTGHMIDTPDRIHPRLPAHLETAAAARIERVLTELNAGAADLGLTQGAAGGDLLFVEACLHRGTPVQLALPLAEPDFIEKSILPSTHGAAWKNRYVAVKAALSWPPIVMPAVAGDPFDACNAWILHAAANCGAAELHLICLWDGGLGDGPGGTAHMVREARRLGGCIAWIDTRTL